ncbi:GNAT family N-acetyltransferase [Sphaerisporangium fuscum]|uniref:GNAT family N-acetyltransferase n=1 Tax=Sphaerisporangium fuscum TaxID=2835868 RepID=UPI001BDD10A9|nr:GNAT family N-acetyltransferase [Sphaerisporangium fuscum]
MPESETRTVASPQESARFGCSVERLTVPGGARFPSVREAILASAADVIVVRYPAEHVDWFARLTALGRTAVFADSLAYWRLRAGEGRAPGPSAGLSPRPVGEVAEVRRLVAEIFSSYRNHYLANPLFGASQALAGYQEWAVRSAAERGCLGLWSADEEAFLALATLDEDGPRTEILLAGVVPQAQGGGLYAHLLRGVEERTLARGAREVLISTQGHNVRVQRAWARYGFEPVEAVLTVHLIRPRLPRAGDR